MKKVILFLFLLASMVVSAKTYLVNTSSPPGSKSATFENAAATIMLQTPIAEIPQSDVGLCERDVSCSVSFEKCQSVIPATVTVQCAVSFQLLANQNCVSVSSGKPDVILQAVSPQCRAVQQNFSFNNIMTSYATQTLNQAVSPQCRDVITIMMV